MKKEELMKKETCTLCGNFYDGFAFKGGYVCEDCLKSIKRDDQTD